MPRSYDQYCPAARALDAIGERWSLLIVRDLLAGPKRFKELREGLPGIATNLLSQRLRKLEQDEVLRRTELPLPAGTAVYELTERGRALQPVLRELARWGTPRLGRPRRGDDVNLDRLMLAGLGEIKPIQPPPELRETYELHAGNAVYTICVADGRADIRPGPAEQPDLVVRMPRKTLLSSVAGPLSDQEARGIRFEGPREAVAHWVELFRSR